MSETAPDHQGHPPGWRDRGSDEFSRVLAFSDGLFAIAMTLLVVTITVPTLRAAGSETEMARALRDLSPAFLSFAISFIVIGRYWRAHHVFFSLLRATDPRLITINLVYLGFIAFLPFPTDLLGTYFHNALSVALYAATVSVISALEVVMFRHARRAGLLRRTMPRAVFQWGTVVSVLPVTFFLVSIPIAFHSVQLAVAIWLLGFPAGWIAHRFKPPDADEYLN